MPTHGTALTDGQLAEFLGNGTRALALIASKLGPQCAHYWDGKSEKMQERLLKALMLFLLDPIGTVPVPATSEPFVVREKYLLNCGEQVRPGVRISYLGENFSTWCCGKVEKPMNGTTLRYAKLLERSVDGPIMDELGDSKETSLAQVFHLLSLQPNGEAGVLLTNGYANIFYVRDFNGTLRVVSVYWSGGGWGVRANDVAYPHGWNDGDHVFSRNS